MHVQLPRRLAMDTLTELVASVGRIHGFPRAIDTVVFDASGVTFVEPVGLAALAALLKLVQVKKDPDVKLYLRRPRDLDVWNYLARMDFLQEFGIDVGHGRLPSGGRFAELRSFGMQDMASHEITLELCDIARVNWPANDDAVALMGYGLGECVDNTVFHSGSPVGGFACAQVYRRRRRMQFAICDIGMGIRRSLSQRYEVKTDGAAIQLAIQKGVSGKSSGHSGEGLFIINQMIKVNKGRLLIYSGNSMYSLDGLKSSPSLMRTPRFPGTLVGIEIDTSPPATLKTIIDQLFPQDRMDDWEDWPIGEEIG